MSEIVFLPFQQTCNVIALVEAAFVQRVTLKDLETGQVHGPYVGEGRNVEIGRTTIATGNRGGDPRGYRVEVVIESAANRSGPFGMSRTTQFPGGSEPWTFCTVGSEDVGSSDNDWNDAYVVFNFPFRLFNGPNTFTSRERLEAFLRESGAHNLFLTGAVKTGTCTCSEVSRTPLAGGNFRYLFACVRDGKFLNVTIDAANDNEAKQLAEQECQSTRQ